MLGSFFRPPTSLSVPLDEARQRTEQLDDILTGAVAGLRLAHSILASAEEGIKLLSREDAGAKKKLCAEALSEVLELQATVRQVLNEESK